MCSSWMVMSSRVLEAHGGIDEVFVKELAAKATTHGVPRCRLRRRRRQINVERSSNCFARHRCEKYLRENIMQPYIPDPLPLTELD